MRISTRIAAGGNRSLTRIALAQQLLKDCLGPDGKIDRVKAQLAFSGTAGNDGWSPFTPSSRDNSSVYSVCMVFMEVLSDALDTVADSPDNDCHRGVETRQDERLEAKMDRGKFVFVRQTVNPVADGVTVNVEIGNPYKVVGEAEAEARYHALTLTQQWLRLMGDYKWVRFAQGMDAALVEEAKANNAATDERARFAVCGRRVNGYCSPCEPDCKFYRRGECLFGRKTNKTNKE